jgi:hypothetical protein
MQNCFKIGIFSIGVGRFLRNTKDNFEAISTDYTLNFAFFVVIYKNRSIHSQIIRV